MYEKDYKVLNDFLIRWPKEKLDSLTLAAYALGAKNYKETFSYWVEEVTHNLGDIGGIGGGGSFKHGIYYMSNKKKYTGNKTDDSTYAWWVKYGNNANEAFQKIKSILLSVVNYSIANNWEQIDKIDFYSPIKWKWAFLYSNNNLFPVYKKEALEIAARHLDYQGNDYSYPTLYRYLISQKEENEDNFSLSERVWNLYLSNKPCNYYILGSKYGENATEDVFPQMLEQNVISTGFAYGIDLSDYVGKPQNEIVKYLEEKGEESKSYSCLKLFLNIKPGDKVAVKADGNPKGSNPFLSIVGIAEAIENEEDYYSCEPDELGHTITVKWLKAPVYKEFDIGGYGRTIHKLSDPTIIDRIFNSEYDIVKSQATLDKTLVNMGKQSLNTILYGPPGTGKTYKSISMAVSIANPDFLVSNKIELNANSYSDEHYKLILEEFDNLRDEGRIELITFHQNYSYEDFIQGIKPDVTKSQLNFNKVDGIFKKTVVNALFEQFKESNIPKVSKEQNEISFDSLYDSMINTWQAENEKIFDTKKKFKVVLKSINDRSNLQLSHKILTHIDKETNKWVYGDSRVYNVSRVRVKKLYENIKTKENFDKITNIDKSIRSIIGGCNTTMYWVVLKELFAIKESWVSNENAEIENEKFDSLSYDDKVIEVNNYITDGEAPKESFPFVFVIDEINRANISRVFGDLITLIETDKRWGNKHQLVVKLPSGDLFTVPNNLYIIGTMNTADKSIALLDIALRRRFSFLPLYPDYSLMGEFEKIIKPLNEKLYELKKSPDFMIGHSFFIGKNFSDLEVASIFNDSIIPLLFEYLPHYRANDLKGMLATIGISIDEPNIENNYQLKCLGIAK